MLNQNTKQILKSTPINKKKVVIDESFFTKRNSVKKDTRPPLPSDESNDDEAKKLLMDDEMDPSFFLRKRDSRMDDDDDDLEPVINTISTGDDNNIPMDNLPNDMWELEGDSVDIYGLSSAVNAELQWYQQYLTNRVSALISSAGRKEAELRDVYGSSDPVTPTGIPQQEIDTAMKLFRDELTSLSHKLINRLKVSVEKCLKDKLDEPSERNAPKKVDILSIPGRQNAFQERERSIQSLIDQIEDVWDSADGIKESAFDKKLRTRYGYSTEQLRKDLKLFDEKSKNKYGRNR